MSAKKSQVDLKVFVGTKPDWLTSEVQLEARLKQSKLFLVCLTDDSTWESYTSQNPLPWSKISNIGDYAVVFVYDVQPIKASTFQSWRNALLNQGFRACRVLLRSPLLSEHEELEEWLVDSIADLAPEPESQVKEAEAFQVGQFIEIDPNAERFDLENALLSLAFGGMQSVVEELDMMRRQFLKVISISPQTREELVAIMEIGLQDSENSRKKGSESEVSSFKRLYREKCQQHGISKIYPNSIPKVLLTGETGTGKTLFARSLAMDMAGTEIPFHRISIPEFSGQEAAFEYEAFGAKGGSYTDAPKTGRLGCFASYIGGIVFLDEIGEASPTMQAKLLAYFDDFRVLPRGMGRSFFSPVMVIAATNQNLEKMAKKGTFRKDLLRRFSAQVEIPSLNARKDYFSLILDTLLQQKGINPEKEGRSQRYVTNIGEDAAKMLESIDYTDKNFRYLENLLRSAVQRATRQGRNQIVGPDISTGQ